MVRPDPGRGTVCRRHCAARLYGRIGGGRSVAYVLGAGPIPPSPRAARRWAMKTAAVGALKPGFLIASPVRALPLTRVLGLLLGQIKKGYIYYIARS